METLFEKLDLPVAIKNVPKNYVVYPKKLSQKLIMQFIRRIIPVSYCVCVYAVLIFGDLERIYESVDIKD